MAQDFAVILLDVRMPDMDGFETAALIRQRRQSEMTPIIFITAYGSDEIPRSDRYAEGAVDFIFAPVAPGRAAGQGLGVRQPLPPGARSWPRGARGPGVRRPAPAADRRRADRHLPDRRREPVRVHEPAVVRDHRCPAARKPPARRGRPSSTRAAPPIRRRAARWRAAQRAQRAVRDPAPGLGIPDRARHVEAHPGPSRRHRRLGRDPRRRERRGGGRGGHGDARDEATEAHG